MSHGHCSVELEEKVLGPLQTIFDQANVEKLVQPVGSSDMKCTVNVFEDNEKEVEKSVKRLIMGMKKFGSKAENVRYLEEATQAFYGLYNFFFEATRFVGIVTHPQDYADKCKAWISDPSLERLRRPPHSGAEQEKCFVDFWQRCAVNQCRKRKERAPATPPATDYRSGTLLRAQRDIHAELESLRAEVAKLRADANNRGGSGSVLPSPPPTKRARIVKDVVSDGEYDSSSSSTVSLPKPKVPTNWRAR
ncbi:hypothetical protein FOL47_008955 [Perkinsus chesapeaki]|uniref:Uncharacterized protein n=1 Tax=Perkinsus chesapeaki TaxID=330153 RepID=A0A7J6N352_PERCH|nr:hypothetical protein FOL47_008955 [Perkinsus chesapeaki]